MVDHQRLEAQARAISILLSDAGIGPGTLINGVRTLIAQRDAQKEALETIAGYPIPTFTINGQDYVPASNVVHLRQIARDVLAPAKPGDTTKEPT